MSHEHIVYDTDPHFIIDADTRVISYDSPSKLVLIKGDHNSEVFTFEIPKTIDGHDMTQCNKVQVHFINIDANNSNSKSTGVYEVTDLQPSETDPDNTLVFSWTVSNKATKYVGSLNFTIRLACYTGARVSYAWHSGVYAGVPVSTSIDNLDETVEEYTDVLEQWYWELVMASTTGVNVIDDATNRALAKINMLGGIVISTTEPMNSGITVAAWLNPETGILRIRKSDGSFAALESIKGDPGGLSNIVQYGGTAKDLVMSQDAVTKNFQTMSDGINNIGANLENQITQNAEQITTNKEGISALYTGLQSVVKIITDEQTASREMASDLSALSTSVSNHLATNHAKVSIGSYVGTGLTGSANKNTINLPFRPLLIIIKDPYRELEDFIAMNDFTRINPSDNSTVNYVSVYCKEHPNNSSVSGSPIYYSRRATGKLYYSFNHNADGSYSLSYYYADGGTGEGIGMDQDKVQYNAKDVRYTYLAIGLEV